ncbi:ISAzo13 family transposase [Streptomyces sp. NBC_00237]|uniref:ISAzo13 family transposase n=1 Tax=Streptomyces sp. NBC_00237 TaxID=2975687 RepID=UPI00224CF905|nr:ISAzo13 family transposase [Streptomyces sp. NBC_00237]MCX5205816.1 ISAzo13 family transposase [Streptomyces sp. NBC_00237]
MKVSSETVAALRDKFEEVLPHLDERQRRLLLGSEAGALGHGGIIAVAAAAGVSTATVSRGLEQLRMGPPVLGRQRVPGGGRKPLTTTDPELQGALDALIEPTELGDPASPLRWTTASLRDLSEQLTVTGHPVSATTVGKLLHQMGFSLQAAVRTASGASHPDRDAQFLHIQATAERFLAVGQPVISVDAKKKEAIGNYQRPGRVWRPKGVPVQVDDHTFPADADMITPYGIYDLGEDSGWVNVGTDRNTAAFAVESIRRWWNDRGHLDHPRATALLITADAGGPNGVIFHTWRWQLAGLAREMDVPITVCHFPPGTSKWNKVEHRLFSRITCAWRGIPLTSHEVAVKAIASAHTRTGLVVRAELDTHRYPTGQNPTPWQVATLPLSRDAFHGDWNYTLHPAPEPQRTPPRRTDPAAIVWLSDPALTGMPRQELASLVELVADDWQWLADRDLTRRTGHPRQRPSAHGIGQLEHHIRVLAAVLRARRVATTVLITDILNCHRTYLNRSADGAAVLLARHDVYIAPTEGPKARTRAQLQARIDTARQHQD